MFLQMAPLTRILESIVCESYYIQHPDLEGFIGSGDIPEEMCKGPAVQSSVALLKGWYALLDCIPGKSPTVRFVRCKTQLMNIKGYYWLFRMGLWPISMGERS